MSVRKIDQLPQTGHFTQIPSGKADECNRDFSSTDEPLGIVSMDYYASWRHAEGLRVSMGQLEDGVDCFQVYERCSS